MNRRDALRLGVAAAVEAAAPIVAHAQPTAAGDGVIVIPLWPDGPPEGKATVATLRSKNGDGPFAISADGSLTNVADPRLTVFRPSQPDGSALIIVPGGGYLRQNIEPEGRSVARHFVASGVTCFVLTYRLPGEGWPDRIEVAVNDAERGLATVRAATQNFTVDPSRIGVLGFSAGGHIAGMLSVRAGGLACVALGYPVVTMLKPFAHEASREHLFGDEVNDRTREAFSCERLATEAAPPTFLFAANDDPDVPVENSVMLHASLRRKRVPVELHLFESGGHGFGLGGTGPAAAWPDLFLRWGRSRGIFTR